MNIVFSREAADKLRDRFTILEVDSVRVGEELLECFCVLDADSVPLEEMTHLERKVKMHEDLVSQYRAKNWDFCLEVIPHLTGSFKGTLDSFYTSLATRVAQYKNDGVSADWHWALTK